MTAADVAAFVGLSGDFNPLFADLEHARSSVFGGPVAPGTLVAAVTAGLGSIDVPLPATVGLVGMSWKFLLPVQPGDTISSRWRLSRKRNVENPRWGLAVWQVEVENQRGEVVATAEVARLVAKREQPVEIGRTGRSRRRRRKSAPAGQTAADVVVAEPVPEPAPADVPPPAARRRRRRPGPPEAVPAPEPEPVAGAAAAPGSAAAQNADVPAPETATPARRRRRRRGANGNGGGRAPEGQDGPPAERQDDAPAGVPEALSPPPAAEPDRGSLPSPDSRGGPQPEPEPGGLGRVLRRLRGD